MAPMSVQMRNQLADIVREAMSAPAVPDSRVGMHADYGHKASRDFPWFSYDPEGDGTLFFETEEEAKASAQKAINLSLDDFWSEDVDRICYGRVVAAATQTNRRDRPESLDEDGCDEDGICWTDDCEFLCNYELLPIDAPNELTRLRQRVSDLEAAIRNIKEALAQLDYIDSIIDSADSGDDE